MKREKKQEQFPNKQNENKNNNNNINESTTFFAFEWNWMGDGLAQYSTLITDLTGIFSDSNQYDNDARIHILIILI